MFKKIFPALSCSLLTLVAAGVAQGHGYVEKPGSRNYYCGAVTKPDEVLYGTPVYEECREAFILPDGSANNDGYNFMGILSHTKGAKYVRPLPENVCGFDSEKFGYGETLWDLPIDWPTSEMQAGSNEFIWNISYGPHFSDTEQFRYWITKPDYKFEVGKPLQWSDLEAAPFCEIEWTGESTDTLKADYDNQKFIMNCDVPARSGRHIIYGEWGRTPSTYERFHSCMDVTFGETNTTPGDTKPMVEAEFTIEPNVDVVFGSGVLVLNASQSAGTGLTYQWSYNAGNDAGYRLENANEPVAYLYYEDTTARRDLTINVTVKDDEGQQDSATKAIQHFPLYYSQWSDLGLLTPEAKTLTVGETVFLRLVLNNGQDVYYPVDGLSITEENRQADVWPYQLAQLINASEEQLKLGLLEGDRVEPQQNATSNKVFAHEALNLSLIHI